MTPKVGIKMHEHL